MAALPPLTDRTGTLGYATPQPVYAQPTPQVAPVLPQSPQAPTIGNAPRPTAYGTFTAPDPTAVASDPYYQFRLSEGLKQQQRSAAARGTLLTGGFQKALAGYSQGLASEEAGKAFDRSLAAYDTNRATNQQNFGQQMGSYEGSLGGYDREYRAGRDTYGDARENAYNQAAATNANAGPMDEYRRYLEEQRAANMPPLPPVRGPYDPQPLPYGSLGGR